MDAKTREALKGSIEKWRKIEAGEGMDSGADNCPLCHLFHDKGCDGCPVDYRSGGSGCGGTPYSDFADWSHFGCKGVPGTASPLNPKVHKKGVRLARAEREFLESLLPEDDDG